jgi:hypothetical protein
MGGAGKRRFEVCTREPRRVGDHGARLTSASRSCLEFAAAVYHVTVQCDHFGAVFHILEGAYPAGDLLGVLGVEEVLGPALAEEAGGVDDENLPLPRAGSRRTALSHAVREIERTNPGRIGVYRRGG